MVYLGVQYLRGTDIVGVPRAVVLQQRLPAKATKLCWWGPVTRNCIFKFRENSPPSLFSSDNVVDICFVYSYRVGASSGEVGCEEGLLGTGTGGRRLRADGNPGILPDCAIRWVAIFIIVSRGVVVSNVKRKLEVFRRGG